MNTIHHQSSIDLSVFHKIDINLYPMFAAVYEQKSISKAAQLLCVSQSAASHALQRLRILLNDALFVRSGSRMQPTPFAEQIYPVIKNALLAIQNISVQTQQFDPAMIQNIKIAVHDEIEPIIFPKIIQHFQRIGMQLQFFSVKLDRKNIASDLAAQQIDFVIDAQQNFGSHLHFQPLLEDRFAVCTQQPEMSAEQYLASPHIGVSSRRTGMLVEDLFLSKNKLSRQIFFRCQHYATALQILMQHPDAVLTIPKTILSHLQIDPVLKIFEAPVQLPSMILGLYWDKGMEMNLRHQFLKKEIIKIFT